MVLQSDGQAAVKSEADDCLEGFVGVGSFLGRTGKIGLLLLVF